MYCFYRRTFQELKKSEQDLAVLAQLQTHRRASQLLKFYTEKTARGRSQCKEAGVLQRHSLLYYFCDVKICKNMYCWLHDLSSHRFYMLCKHYDEHGKYFFCLSLILILFVLNSQVTHCSI